MTRWNLIGAVTFLALIGCSDRDRTAVDPPSPQVRSTYEASAIAAGGMVTSLDDDGRPRFIWASGKQPAVRAGSPERAAREHLERFAAAYGIARADAARTRVLSIRRTRRGDHMVRLGQAVDGVPVYRGEVLVVLRPDLSLRLLSGTPSRTVGAKPADRRFLLDPGAALARALEDLYRIPVPAAFPSQARGGDTFLELPTLAAVQLSGPARARPVFYREGDRLVAAYMTEFFSTRDPSTRSDAFRYLVAADDGRTLERHDLTADVAFNYRVYAEPTEEGRPLDGPIADYTPHPAGVPDGTDPAFLDPILVSMESFKNQPEGEIDPWLAASASQTSGNNVDAYADLNQPDGYSNGDLRASTTTALTFNRAYDTDLEPSASRRQRMASITNLFYVVNWLHDYWYDSGFDEAAGNAQVNNFGRGGAGSDPIRAEAQDSGGLNNANMQTPSDGLPPRMQMFLWTGPESRSLAVDPGGLSLVTGFAAFGPTDFDLTDDLILADDGVAPNTDACSALSNDVAGRIVLVDRGACSFALKTQAAEAAGAVGVIIANNVAGPPPNLANTVPPTVVTIPTLSVSLDDGNNLKALLGAGAVTVRMQREVGVGRDGSLDNMIIAHEWGHFFHHRLTDCTSFQCGAQSEGWGDFVALHMALRDGDDLDGTYGAGIYGPRLIGDTGYFGIRRFPYSVDPSRNGLSFRHVQNGEPLPATPIQPNSAPNSEVHNAGEVWTSMLFQAYVDLQRNPGARTFDEVRRDFADYMVLGLELAPVNATITETRDAILAAIAMTEPGDLQVVAGAFAVRGAGSCAIGPPRDAATDLAPVTESFATQPSIEVLSVELDDSVVSCDYDGVLDSGETARVAIQVANKGPAAMTDTVVTLSSTTSGVVFPGPTSATIPSVAPFGAETVDIDIALDGSVSAMGLLDLTVTVENADACLTSVVLVQTPRIHADELLAASATEDVEASSPPWSMTGTAADGVWSRAELAPGDHAWRGLDSGSVTDAQLVSPALQVSAADAFVISFDHAFSFEADTIFWDGGVIELSSDGGVTWEDVSVFADPGYSGTITDTSGNPLAGRQAYSGQNASYPATDPVSLDLGTALAGETVLVRFRIGTDAAVGAPGWTIDDIAFAGIDNTPFTQVIDHAGTCQLPPIANAGLDRTVDGGDDVILGAGGSSDPNGDPLTFAWTQTAGTPVVLENPGTMSAAFVAPTSTSEQVLSFQVQVSDDFASSTDSVDVTVRGTESDAGAADAGSDGDPDAGPGAPDAGDPGEGDGDDDEDGCGCAAGGDGGLSFVSLLGVALLLRRRRRG